MVGYLFLSILTLSLVAFLVGRATALRFVAARARHGPAAHSVPAYHGAFVAIWVGIPALVLSVLWLLGEGLVIDELLLRSLPAEMTTGLGPGARDLLLAEIRNVAAGRFVAPPSAAVAEAAARSLAWTRIAKAAMFVVLLCVMLIGAFAAHARLSPGFRAREQVERAISAAMLLCAGLAIVTTLGIVVSLAREALAFFRMISVGEFLFGARWAPNPIGGAFGAAPVFLGTFLVATIAMAIAVPIGLLSAIYLVEYASARFRRAVKPMLEILAGVPTVVYGFFAILVVSPAVETAGSLAGLTTSPNSALAAGFVIGIMVLPFISSLADDALRAVPRELRDGSLAMGATRAETMTKVLLPAAMPGIAGGVLLAFSRAIGETMIVVMAAGLTATMTLNPLDSVTTVTVQIVSMLAGDAAYDNPRTLAAFALGLALFLVTLTLNALGAEILRRYREAYE